MPAAVVVDAASLLPLAPLLLLFTAHMFSIALAAQCATAASRSPACLTRTGAAAAAPGSSLLQLLPWEAACSLVVR